ncbi:MAG: phasin family protein [Magnetococcales bacterium]|nr:phasin family protein [Magnetococcales bacterium]
MDQNIAENFAKFTENMMDSMQKLQEINEKTLKELTSQQFQSAQDFIKTGSEQIEQLGKSKTVEEAVSEQTKITSTMGKMVLDSAQATMEVLTNGQKDLENLIKTAVKDGMKSKG